MACLGGDGFTGVSEDDGDILVIGGGEILKEIFGGNGFDQVHAAGTLLTDGDGGNKITVILGVIQHGFIVAKAGVMIDGDWGRPERLFMLVALDIAVTWQL